MAKTITWTAPEYEHRERRPDWFWALGVIAVSASIAAIIFKNYLFAIFIILGTALLIFFSVRKPNIMEIEINEEGIQVEDTFYPHETIGSFWIDQSRENHKLLILSDRFFMPVITIPLENVSEEDIIDLLDNYLPLEELHEPFAHKFMEYLGF